MCVTGFSVTAIMTLALGIGAVTSVFTTAYSILLNPIALNHPDRLVVLRESIPDSGNAPMPDNYKHYLNWEANAKSLAGVTIFGNQLFSVSKDTEYPQIVRGLRVSPNFFSVIGIAPVLGRGFLPIESTKGKDRVIILTWNAWRKYFHGDPEAIGRTLDIGDVSQTVVGIMPQGFSFPNMNEMSTAVSQQGVQPYEIFKPLVPEPSWKVDDGDYNFLALGRLQNGVSRGHAQAELDGLQAAFASAAHISIRLSILVEPLNQEVSGKVSTALWLLLASVGAVLLIACVNLANLQLARAVAREREMALRAALGARRGRLLWIGLTESLVLAAVGGLLGILASIAGVRLFTAVAPSSLPRLDEIHVSWLPLLVAAGLSIATALLFGALPALRSMRVDPQSALQSNPSRLANTREGQRTRHLLVAGEVACTVVLLIVGGLLIHSFSRLMTQQRGFDSSHVTLAEVDLYASQYSNASNLSGAVRAAFVDRALNDLSMLPGVQSTAMTSQMPLSGDIWEDGIRRTDHPVRDGQEPTVNVRWVSPGYIATIKIPLVEGRTLENSDKDHPANALISAETARAAWPGEDPLGKEFKLSDNTPMTVVGVVADARINNLKNAGSMVYLPYWQNPPTRVFLLVRSSGHSSGELNSVRRVIWHIDSRVAIRTLKSLDEQVSDSVALERFQTWLLSGFAVAALLLSMLGVYGVIAYSVSLRQQEFGIRIALGSDRQALIQLVALQAAVPVAGGVVVGLLMALAASRLAQSLLYETRATDPFAITAGIAILLMTAFLAALFPALRAARVDPMRVLRNE